MSSVLLQKKNMPEIFNYTHYRNYLNDFIAEKRGLNPYFSFRFIGRKVGIDAGNLVKILQNGRHLPNRYIAPFIELCGLKGRRARYFEVLVRFCRVKRGDLARELFEQLCELKQAPSRTLESRYYHYFSKWHFAAIRSLLDYFDFKGNFDELATQLEPPISAAEARQAIKLLSDIGFISKMAHGRYKPTDKIVSTGERWQSLAIEKFQEQVIDLAKQSISRFAKDVRDISTITMNLNKQDFERIRGILKQCRQEILKVVDAAGDTGNVYQLNMQLFPLTIQKKGSGKS